LFAAAAQSGLLFGSSYQLQKFTMCIQFAKRLWVSKNCSNNNNNKTICILLCAHFDGIMPEENCTGEREMKTLECLGNKFKSGPENSQKTVAWQTKALNLFAPEP